MRLERPALLCLNSTITKHQKWLLHRRAYRKQFRDEINAYKRASSKAALQKAKRDPLTLAALRDKRATAKRRWLRKMKSLRPKAWAAYQQREARKERERRRTNPQRRISCMLRTKIYVALIGISKAARTVELLGCDIPGLIRHLENRWLTGMSWQNYGRSATSWSVDHIKPCAAFDLTDPLQQSICFHFSNLRPCWHRENQSKSSRWNGKLHRYAH